ncbi:lipase member H-like [Battus philenor]|uniref:lipase member H-like n=1 Tax=Battus philenor TaxID=42288 RepID=UPI0035CFBEA4
MGYAGMFMNSEVHRITGLDPARPLFEFPLLPKDFRLEKSDARFVDIIHTCGGYFGYKYSQGHADFYPNGGKCGQPGCPAHRELIDSCSHGRSVVYFNESILYTKNRGFTAYPCESWKSFENGLCTMNKTTMGYLVGDVRGDYYLHTKNASKYAIFNENYYY